MAISNQTPFRPYITLMQVLPDGTAVPGYEDIYKIPYNYISEFRIDYTAGGLGEVKLNLFDLDYDWLLNGLLSGTHKNSGAPEINFLITFGWQDNGVASILSEIWPRGFSSKKPPGIYVDRYTGKKISKGKLRSGYSKSRRIVSQSHVVCFTKIDLNLSEVGVELNLTGYNFFSEHLKLLGNLDASYFGFPWQIIEALKKDVDIQIIWDVVNENFKGFDFENTIEYLFKQNPFSCGNRLVGDILKELVESIKIDGVANQLDYYTDGFFKVGDRLRPKIRIFKKTQHIDSSNFLGTFNYFTGKESHIVDSIDFEIPNLIDFLGDTISTKTVDVGTKQIPPTTETINGVPTNKGLRKNKDRKGWFYDQKIGRWKTLKVAQKTAAKPKGSTFTTKSKTQYEDQFFKNVENFIIKANMTIIGDPGIDFMDLQTQSFLELNIHSKNGNLIGMLSGNYFIDKIVHTITETDFTTSLSVIKWKFDRKDDLTPVKKKLGRG